MSQPGPSWDIQFLANPQFRAWTDAQLLVAPKPRTQPLVEYVRERIAAQNLRAATAAAASGTSSSSSTPPPFSSVLSTVQVQQAHIRLEQQRQLQMQQAQEQARAQAQAQTRAQQGHNDASPTSSFGDVSDIFELSSFPGDGDSTAASSASFSPYSEQSPAIASSSTLPSSSIYNFAAQQPSQPSYFQQLSQPPPQIPLAIDPSLVNPRAYQALSSLDIQRQAFLEQQQQQQPTLGANWSSLPNDRVITLAQSLGGRSPTFTPSSFPPSAFSQSAAATAPAQRATPPLPTPSPAPSTTSTASSTSTLVPPPPTLAPHPPAPPVVQTPWQKGLPTLREQLTSARFSRFSAITASKLARHLTAFRVDGAGSPTSEWGDASDVPPEGRKEVLEALVKWGATGDFWVNWLGEQGGMEVLVEWLMGASAAVAGGKGKGKGGEKRKEVEATLGLVMKVFAALPLKFEHLVKYKIAKRVKQISASDKVADPQAKKVAVDLVAKWVTLQQEQDAGRGPDVKAEGASKRKADASDGPKKKTKVVEKPVAAPKPKPAVVAAPLFNTKTPLPSFKKRPEAPIDPFSQAMQSLGPAVGAKPKPKEEPGLASIVASKGKDKKPKVKKRVRWVSDEALQQIRWIEKAIYDDDEEKPEIELGLDEARDMEVQEGATLHQHLDEEEDEEDEVSIEEEIAWQAPIVLDLSADPLTQSQAFPDSPEPRLQTEREAHTMQVDYSEPAEIPSSPGEPPDFVGDDFTTQEISLSAALRDDPTFQEAILHAQLSGASPKVFADAGDLKNLLSKLQNFQGNPFAPVATAKQPQVNPYGIQMQHGYPYGNNQGQEQGGYAPPPPHQNWQGQPDPMEKKGGRGAALKGKKNVVVCRFFRSGRGCDWGDKCRNIH